MRGYDGAEVFELVDTYLLFLISEKYSKKDFKLFCYEGLELTKKVDQKQKKKIKINIQKIFKEIKLDSNAT